MSILDRKLGRDLWHLRGQVIAIALVVTCGIASFILARSTYDSLELTQADYYNRYHFAQVFASLKRGPETLKEQIAAIPGVARVQTRIVMDVTLDVPGLAEPATGRLVSIPERQTSILNRLFLRQGRYLEAGKREEAIASEAFANANQLQVGDTIGAIINGRWQRLQLVGLALSPEYVYEVRGIESLYPDNKRFGIIWLGREALGNAFDMDGAFNNVTLTLAPRAQQQEVITRLDKLLERYGGLGAYGREDQLSHRILSDDIQQLNVLATFLPSIFLGIAAFLLNAILSRLIGIQREQIGVLKAFGYSNLAVGYHYLKFVLVAIGMGALLGIGLGLWLGRGLLDFYTDFYRFPFPRYTVSSQLLATAILVSFAAAALGGLMSVRQAVTLPPAVAMKPEPPPQFRPTLIERWGVQRLFSPASRIILRNLERKPRQAFLSLLGIAIAAALLVAGLYIKDALNYLVEVQFHLVQRQDVTITFQEPRPSRTRYEVARLPGVIRSEPFRIVAARLRFRHRTYRTALTGIEPNGEFRRLIGKDLYAVHLPAEGVVLTAKLAEILGVRPGDTITVEVLEENRPVRQVAVVGTVDELLGLQAYLDIRALNRLLQEGQTISGAFLAVDAHRATDLYAQIKRLPAIAGFSTREAAIKSFQETTAQILLAFTSVLVIFASIITFSVVYNSSRIALSERGRELASLRIVGFTRGEVAFILLGEQAILTLLAIPVGWGLGFGLAALMSFSFNAELYRLPLVISQGTYAWALAIVLLAALASGLIIRRQLAHLDLIGVLKTRE